MSSIPVPSLYIDPSIRDWVLFPITLVMLLVGLLRHYVTMLLNSPPKKQPAATVREQRALLRAQLLRASAPLSPLPPAAYKSMTEAISSGLASGEYLKPVAEKKGGEDGMPPNPLTDPSQMENMMDGLKKQGVMMVPNLVLSQWVNIFFGGLVLIKLPFPLTLGFRAMLSRDLATPDLDIRWVSALSWYFLNLFGLNGIFKLILGHENAADGTRDQSAAAMLSGAGAASPMGPGQPDMQKVFKSEIENLELSLGLYRWVGDGVESRVLERWGRSVKV